MGRSQRRGGAWTAPCPYYVGPLQPASSGRPAYAILHHACMTPSLFAIDARDSRRRGNSDKSERSGWDGQRRGAEAEGGGGVDRRVPCRAPSSTPHEPFSSQNDRISSEPALVVSLSRWRWSCWWTGLAGMTYLPVWVGLVSSRAGSSCSLAVAILSRPTPPVDEDVCVSLRSCC